MDESVGFSTRHQYSTTKGIQQDTRSALKNSTVRLQLYVSHNHGVSQSNHSPGRRLRFDVGMEFVLVTEQQDKCMAE